MLGSNLNTVVATDKAGAGCQAAVLKAVENLFLAKAKLFRGCKKAGLAGKPSLMVSAPQLATCFAAVATDAHGKIGKAVGKLGGAISGKCTGALAVLLPGACGSAGNVP